MDGELERVIARLEARFDAALAGEDERAARDLELTLRQDRTLADLIRAGGSLRLLEGDGAMTPVSVVGADYCGTGTPVSCVRRLGSAPLMIDEAGLAPETRRDSLQEVARRWSRGRRRVELILEAGRWQGLLLQVGPDNVVLEGVGESRIIVPWWLVRSIRLAHGG